MGVSKAERERKKQLAYTLYVENGFEQKVIAETIGVSEKTVSNWKNKDNADWDADRDEARMGFEQQRKRLRKQISTMLDIIENRESPYNVPDSKESDTLNKIADAAKKLMTELSFAHKSETGKQFIRYIQLTYGQAKAVEQVDLWHEFLMATS